MNLDGIEIQNKMVRYSLCAIQIPLARMISNGDLSLDELEAPQLLQLIEDEIGNNEGNAFELYTNDIADRIALISTAIESNNWDSAALLLATLIEGNINEVLRLSLSFRGYTHSEITKHIKGSQLDVRATLFLDLLNIELGNRLKTLLSQLRNPRNEHAHEKREPELFSDEFDKGASTRRVFERSKATLERVNLDDIESDLERLHKNALESIPHLKQVNEHINRIYQARGEQPEYANPDQVSS